MFSFNLKGKSGILIFTLFGNRLGEGRTYTSYGSEQKRLNSYAFFNIDTKELKIVHYDYIKARIYDRSILAYTISPGERIIGLRGNSCYYIDHNGQEIGYAGDLLFFHKYHIDESKSESFDKKANTNRLPDFDEFESPEKQGFKIDGNKIVFNNGELYHSDYLLKDKFRNIITCYFVINKKEYYETRLFGICDNHGKLLSEIKYDEIWASENQIIRDKYLRVKINGKFGLISLDGKEILPVVYEFIDDCDGNIAIVNHGKQLLSVNDLSVLYETEGRILKNVDGWMRLVTGYYPGTSYGLLDSTGKLYEFYNKKKFWGEKEKYKALGASFHDGLLPVFSTDRGYGYVDIDSNEVIECKYCEISDFENGKAKVRLDCEYGYINTEGSMLVYNNGKEIAIPKTYDWAYDYKNGYYIVQKGNLYGAIDEFMHELIPCSLKTKEEVELTYSKIKLHALSLAKDTYEEKYKDLLPPIRYEENKWYGYKSANEEMFFPPVLKVGKFVEGMAIVNIYGKYGYINEKLELAIEPKYDYACDFSEGLALVHEIGKGNMFINKLGEVVISCNYHLERIGSFNNGVAECEYNYCQPGRDNESDKITKYCVGYKITW